MTEDMRDRLHLIVDILKAALASFFLLEWAVRGIFYLVNKGVIH